MKNRHGCSTIWRETPATSDNICYKTWKNKDLRGGGGCFDVHLLSNFHNSEEGGL